MTTTQQPGEHVQGDDRLRPSVRVFARLMEAKLRENDHKGGWRRCSTGYLTRRCGNELDELRELIHRLARMPNRHPAPTVEESIAIGREAADVANFALMLADNLGALDAFRAVPAVAAAKPEEPARGHAHEVQTFPSSAEEQLSCGGCGGRSAPWEGWQRPDVGQCWWIWDVAAQVWCFACKDDETAVVAPEPAGQPQEAPREPRAACKFPAWCGRYPFPPMSDGAYVLDGDVARCMECWNRIAHDERLPGSETGGR
jgi:hypothetical protein